jgi:hypothetical protein
MKDDGFAHVWGLIESIPVNLSCKGTVTLLMILYITRGLDTKMFRNKIVYLAKSCVLLDGALQEWDRIVRLLVSSEDWRNNTDF